MKALNKVILFLVLLSPHISHAFCCPPVKTIQLTSTTDGRAFKLRGKAEVNQCYGMSFVHIVVIGNMPNGSQLIPVFRGRQPIMGNWFNLSNQHGDTVMEAMSLQTVTGKTLSITDETYTDLLVGKF